VLSPDLQQALKLHQTGRLQEAEAIYRRVFAQQPDHPVVPHLLGVLTAQTGRRAEAYELLRKATELQPRNAEVFNDIGSLTAMQGRLSEAETWLRKAIAIAPNHIGALASLAKVLQQQERSSEAEACAKVVLRAAPGRPDMLNVLAIGYYFRHRLEEAEQACREGLAKAPNDPDLYNTFGLILRDHHRLDESVAAFEKAIELQPRNAMPLYNLGICHHQRGAHTRAEACFRTVLEREPQNENAKYCLGEALVAQGRTAEGRQILDDILQRDGRNWLVRWSRLLTLPIIYENQAQLDETRADFDRQLAGLEADVPLYLPTDLPNILRGAQDKTDFLLHYHGRNDVALQRRFGGLITRIAEAAYPAHAKPVSKRACAPGERIRVGFASAHFYGHSVSKTHGAWITELPRDRFSVSLFHLFAESDETTERLKQNATYHACGTLSQEELIARIAAARLDVLIWLDIGMEARAQIPSALRLAPVQATGWCDCLICPSPTRGRRRRPAHRPRRSTSSRQQARPCSCARKACSS
jgi:protein O-GlcNAc transferase